MMLETLFDGWTHNLVPGEDFQVDRVTPTTDFDEDEEIQPYESPTPIVEWKNAGAEYPAGPLPGQDEESAWGGVSMALSSLVEIIGGKKRSFQENTYSPDRKTLLERKYSFTFIPGDTGYQEGRL